MPLVPRAPASSRRLFALRRPRQYSLARLSGQPTSPSGMSGGSNPRRTSPGRPHSGPRGLCCNATFHCREFFRSGPSTIPRNVSSWKLPTRTKSATPSPVTSAMWTVGRHFTFGSPGLSRASTAANDSEPADSGDSTTNTAAVMPTQRVTQRSRSIGPSLARARCASHVSSRVKWVPGGGGYSLAQSSSSLIIASTSL